jgi:hypothetical protein
VAEEAEAEVLKEPVVALLVALLVRLAAAQVPRSAQVVLVSRARMATASTPVVVAGVLGVLAAANSKFGLLGISPLVLLDESLPEAAMAVPVVTAEPASVVVMMVVAAAVVVQVVEVDERLSPTKARSQTPVPSTQLLVLLVLLVLLASATRAPRLALLVALAPMASSS